jgi:serine/threonine-protein kinase
MGDRATPDAHAPTLARVPAAESADPMVGQVIAERYRVLERIGRGGMGAVYAVEHLTTRRRCAIKTLLPGLGRVHEIARRFEREARAASLLDHPNIISVTDFGTLDDGALFLVMEYVRGRPLGDLIDGGGVSPAHALAITRQVLGALGHAHAHGVIHRDLKPDNIMVEDTEDGPQVKLLDFGIAKLIGESEGADKLTQAGVAFGTPDYMAPEQALGEPVDGRADLYAMGVILFELLARRKPFVNADKMAVLRMQVAVEPPSLAAASESPFPARIEEVVARALEKRRDDRFPAAADFIAALDGAAEELFGGASVATSPAAEPVSAPPAPAAEPVSAPPAPARAQVSPTVALLSAGTLADFARARPFLLRLAVVGVPLLTLVIVLIVLAAQGAGGGGDGEKVAPPAKSKVTPLAQQATSRLAGGDAEGAVAMLEAELDGAGAKDARAHLVLGHARAELGRDIEALAAYERAVELDPGLAGDETMRRNASAMLGRKSTTVTLAAIAFLADRVAGEIKPVVVEAASSHRHKETRARARATAEKRGWMDAVDRVESYGLDLTQGASCAERARAVPKLRETNDKRAISPLKKARGRRGGGVLGFGSSRVNGCLEKEAKEAIDYLEKLP